MNDLQQYEAALQYRCEVIDYVGRVADELYNSPEIYREPSRDDINRALRAIVDIPNMTALPTEWISAATREIICRLVILNGIQEVASMAGFKSSHADYKDVTFGIGLICLTTIPFKIHAPQYGIRVSEWREELNRRYRKMRKAREQSKRS